MNIDFNKLIARDVIREINLLSYPDWTAEQRQERIEVMQKALNIVNQVLEDISPMDFTSRLYFSSEKGQIEHYLKICIDQVPVESTQENFIPDDFEPFVTGSIPARPVWDSPKPNYPSHRGILFLLLGTIMIIATIILLLFVL